MNRLKIVRWGWVALMYLFLAACGGDDGGVVGTGLIELSGTAATGKPLADANITVKDRTGKKRPAKTDANGKYKVDVSGMTEPYLIKVDYHDEDAGDSRALYAAAATGGVANIHPLSDVASRNWFGSRGRNIDQEFDSDNEITNPPKESELTALSGVLRSLLRIAYQQFGMDANFDFDRTPFEADGSKFDGLLDNLTITIEKNKITILLRDPKTGLQAVIIIDFDLSDDLAQPDTIAPDLPTGLQVLKASPTGLVVVWNSPQDNIGVAGYNIYRDGVKVATSPYPMFSDTGLIAATPYCYTVEAFDGAGNTSAPTAPVCATTPDVADTVAPSVPQIQTPNPIGAKSVAFAWVPAPEDDTLGYHIYRGAPGTVNQKIATTVASGFTDTGLSAATQYCYQVRAFDAALNLSPPSAETCVTTPADNPPTDTTAPSSSASPAGGPYTAAQTVTLTCNDGSGSGCAAIYYTMGGSEPSTLSPVYTQPFVIGASTTVRFFAVDQAGNVESPKHSELYVISDSISPVNTTVPNFINSGAANTGSANVTLSLAATDNIAVSAYFAATTTTSTVPATPAPGAAGWQSVTTGTSYSGNTSYTPTGTPASGDTLYVHVWFKDAAGNVSQVASDSVVYVPVVGNMPPVANAGVGQNVKTGSTVTLNGGTSSDADGDSLLFTWTITSQPVGSTATLADANTAYPRIVPDKDGAYALSLVVNDGKANSTLAVVNITAAAATTNRAPIADAGINQSFALAEPVQLKGGASTDQDNDPISYQWSFVKIPAGSAAKIADPSAMTTQFNTDLGGNYVAALVVNDGQVNSAADFVTKGLVVTGTEVEPNNTSAEAQLLDHIGWGNPVKAVYEGASTDDWYRFNATKGMTYVIEIFNVSPTLYQAQNGGKTCDNVITNWGLYQKIQDSDGVIVATQCQPNGIGNGHSQTQFTAAANGMYYIKVGHNLQTTTLTGEYQIRILPKHTDAAAAWDATHEPNNAAANAYLMQVGLSNALTGTIEARSALNYTVNADVDWYRFEATAGTTYVIELFNVSATLYQAQNAGNVCNGVNNYNGLYQSVQDSAEVVVTKQCAPNGVANVHSQSQFTATANGTYYIKVGHSYWATTLSGEYRIRILPKHDNAAAAWDANQEPNNAAANAYLMQGGLSNALTGTIEARSGLYYTASSDLDWYRFEATAGTTYVVDLFNVSATLYQAQNAGNICDGVNNYNGLFQVIQDGAGTTVTKQCAPNGVGNVHNQSQFTATVDGTYYIQVGHSYPATALNGEYHLRILPKHDNAAAAWDATYEPNNAAANAYLLQAGAGNALASAIDAHSSLYYNVSSDVDWYRFDATAGITYVIELFNVSATLYQAQNVSNVCDGVNNYSGLYLKLYDATVAELAKQCAANGAAPLQVLLTYTATTSGTYYIRAAHNYPATGLSGTYSIRITTQ